MTKELEGNIVEPSVRYSSNNSGGSWWLDDEDWYNLEKAGWKVDWFKDSEYYGLYDEVARSGRWLGALAGSATRYGLTEKEAIAEWEQVTGQWADEEGCPCCGNPHEFY